MRASTPVAILLSAMVLRDARPFDTHGAVSSTVAVQQQTPKARADWPCGARVDPAYFHLAEGTGGQLLLLAPAEIGDSAALMTAADGHRDTIFRLAGTLNPGLEQFHVPIDVGVESAVFSISVQCLQTAEVVGPDGVPANGPDVTDLSNFRAIRMVTVKQPPAGEWTIRVSGSGLAGITVQARSAVGIRSVEFAREPGGEFTRLPTPGVENTLRIVLAGDATRVSATITSSTFKTLAQVPLVSAGADGSYLGRFTPAGEGFRVLVTGEANGSFFQRVTAQLFTAR
jgi:hypothetical protein